MSLTKTKEIAKKLFAKVNNLPVHLATTSSIKKAYPKFKASVAEHWELLILKLLKRDRKANELQAQPQPQTKYDLIKIQADKLAKIGVSCYGWEFFMGTSVKLSQNGLSLGEIGWSNSRQSWFYRIGRNGISRFVNSLDIAIRSIYPVQNVA
jgi:hypothetical protein